LEVGVVERRSEEQGVEAGSSATQLAVRQLVAPHLRRPHPPFGWARSAVRRSAGPEARCCSPAVICTARPKLPDPSMPTRTA
jgi:hypothetical protein